MPSTLPGASRRDLRPPRSAHSAALLFAVLGVLFLYAYLFTHAGSLLRLPLPQDLAAMAGLSPEGVFDEGRTVITSLWISRSHQFQDNDHEMLAYYLLLAVAFLGVYFLPVTAKRGAIALGAIVMIGAFYGFGSLAGLLVAHGVAYMLLHPPRLARAWMERSGAGTLLRFCAVQSFLLTAYFGSTAAWLLGRQWDLPTGLLLFFGQWMRLILYDVDLRNGLIPGETTFGRYLQNFLSPGMLPNWFSAIESQGPAYTERIYLPEDKNRIAWGGARLLLLALGFFVFGNWFCRQLAELAEVLGVESYRGSLSAMTQRYHEGHELRTATVLATSLINLLKFTVFWAGISHFKVGVWRLFGFDMAPNFNNWLISTDLLDLWGRYTYHYREFLVRAFFYPVFFRLAEWSPRRRIVAATVAAVGVGNMLWGHGVGLIFYGGLTEGTLAFFDRRWSYFALLSAAVAANQLWRMGRRRERRPWTRDRRIILDLLRAYLTIQFFALLHVFAYPGTDATAADLWRVFLRGFGF
ncbi:MAG: hypothetical protein AAB268_03490 [Elusimicrobiota bacterium]